MRIPAELLRSSPRDVTLTPTGIAAVVTASLIGVAAIVSSVLVYNHAMRWRAADRAAVTVPAEVVRLGATRGEHPKWVATYAFVADGRTHEGTSTLGRRDRQERAVGDTLQVRYLPTAPATSWVDGYQPGHIPLVIAPVLLVGLALIAGSMAFMIRNQREMLTNGRPAVATVMDTKKVSHQHGHHYRTKVEYPTFGGGKVTRHFDLSKQPAVGGELLVLYDPDTPNRAMRYPLSLVKPAEG
jgi:hypothetical protein